MIYLTNINLSGNELQNAVIQPLASAPSNPKLGQIYCDSRDSRIKWYNGTNWSVVGVVVESSEYNGSIRVDGVDMSVYTLPKATANILGGIKVGSGLSIDSEGVLSVAESGSVDWNNISNRPTKLSEFTNDENFIDNTCDNLTNYYKKSETYTQSEVNNLIAGIKTIQISVVSVLPTSGESNIIYLVPKTTSQSSNLYDEYIWTGDKFEKIGDTEIDLSDYAKKSELSTVATTGSYNDLNDKPTRLVCKTLTLPQGSTTVSASLTNYAGFLGAYNKNTGEIVLCDITSTNDTLKIDISTAQLYDITIMYLVKE